jgi:DNA-binding MarR family transcriptional regulator
MRINQPEGPTRGQLIEELQFLRSRLDVLTNRLQQPSEDNSSNLIDPVDVGTVKNLIMAREARKQYFNPDLFVDTPWDILVSLYLGELEQRRVTASQLYLAVGGAPTTSIRWTDRLIQEGLVSRIKDPDDGRRIFLELTSAARSAMQDYLAALRGPVPI